MFFEQGELKHMNWMERDLEVMNKAKNEFLDVLRIEGEIDAERCKFLQQSYSIIINSRYRLCHKFVNKIRVLFGDEEEKQKLIKEEIESNKILVVKLCEKYKKDLVFESNEVVYYDLRDSDTTTKKEENDE